MGWSDELLSRRWGTFLAFFILWSLVPIPAGQKSSPGVSKWRLCSNLRRPEQLSTLCCLREWKVFHVLQNLSALFRPYEYWLSVCPWLVQSVHPKICLCWSQKRNQSACPGDCPDFSLLSLIFIFLFVMENISKVHQLVRNQKCMQLVQIKPSQWERDRLWSPVFQLNHPKSTAWNTSCFRKKYNI